MRSFENERPRSAPQRDPDTDPRASPGLGQRASAVLSLQAKAGNRAVTTLIRSRHQTSLQRQGGGAPAPGGAPVSDDGPGGTLAGYAAAVNGGNWQQVASLLAGVASGADVASREGSLNHDQRIALIEAAVSSLGLRAVLVWGPMNGVDAEAVRVGTLFADYDTKLAAHDWAGVAKDLNGFSEADIGKRLALLTPSDRAAIRSAALTVMPGWSDRVTGPIDLFDGTAGGGGTGPRWGPADIARGLAQLQPGVITGEQVGRGGRAIRNLPDPAYALVNPLLQAAHSDIEWAFLVKALGAGHTAAELTTFAGQISGKDVPWLIGNLNVVNENTPAGGTDATAISQQWQMGCGATETQLIRAESDPIFALSLHAGGNVHTPNQSNAPVTQGQAAILTGHGSTPTPIGTAGTGAWVESDMNALSAVTGVTYTRVMITAVLPVNPAGGAVDAEYQKILGWTQRGLMVPMVVGGTPGQTAHYVTALRRDGDKVLVHNPASGATGWLTKAMVLNNTMASICSWNLLAAVDEPSDPAAFTS